MIFVSQSFAIITRESRKQNYLPFQQTLVWHLKNLRLLLETYTIPLMEQIKKSSKNGLDEKGFNPLTTNVSII